MSYLGPKTSNLDPVINYISNGRAYDSTIGWSRYADAAGIQPVDGTGGSPTITWSRNTISALRQGADFRLVKDAADRQGEGVAYDITVDNADLAKVLTVTFDYEVISGTYATGDLTVYLIQDPTGTPVVIQPAGYQVQAGTVGTKLKQIATFQTASNVNDYRLCFHVASTSASAYTLAIDNVVVGPQVVQYGAPVTDWVEFTPTGSWTSNTTYTGKYRRVGDSAEFNVRVSLSGAAPAPQLTINLPFGWTVDPNKVTTGTQKVGFGFTEDVGIAAYDIGVYTAASESTVTPLALGSAASYVNTAGFTNTVPFTFGSSDFATFCFTVPILGWSSTVQMSSDTDTRVVAMRVGATTPGGSLSGASATQFVASPTIDTHGAYDGTSNYTVPCSGIYEVSGSVSVTGTEAVDQFLTLAVYVGSTEKIVGTSRIQAAALTSSPVVVKGLIQCNAGDVITLRTNTNIGTPAFASIGPEYNFFEVRRLSGPSAIAASETVAASYYASGNRTPTSTKAVNYDVRIYDTHGAVTTVVGDIAGWRFTAPIQGKYSVTISSFQSTALAGGSLNIYKNGVIGRNYLVPCTLANHVLNGSAVVELNAGDYIDIRASGAPTLNNVTAEILKVYIHRIGN